MKQLLLDSQLKFFSKKALENTAGEMEALDAITARLSSKGDKIMLCPPLPRIFGPRRNEKQRKREIGKCPNCGLALRNIDIEEWKNIEHQIPNWTKCGEHNKAVQCPKCNQFIYARSSLSPILFGNISDWEIISDPSPNPEGKSI